MVMRIFLRTSLAATLRNGPPAREARRFGKTITDPVPFGMIGARRTNARRVAQSPARSAGFGGRLVLDDPPEAIGVVHGDHAGPIPRQGQHVLPVQPRPDPAPVCRGVTERVAELRLLDGGSEGH